MKLALPALILLAWVLGGCGESEDRLAFQERRIALLEEENQRLREHIRADEARKQDEGEEEIRKTVERQVEEIRGLQFTAPVKYEVLPREDLEKVIAGKIDEHYSAEELHAVGQGFIALGLLPDGFDLRASYVKLLGEQIAAFYDQFADKLFTFEQTPLRKAMNRMILAHELTHALQDQHFALEKLPLLSKDNDDLVMATAALIEGDATMVMTDYMTRIADTTTPVELIGAALSQNTEALAAAPRFLREGLTFPYIQGQLFVSALMRRGGYRAVDAAYALPPQSTSQIMNPDRYLDDPGATPPVLEWQGLERSEVIADNVLGEFGWRVFLVEHGLQDLEAKPWTGWVTDRFLVLKSQAEKPAVVAWTEWSSAKVADAFERALSDVSHTRWEESDRAFSIDRPQSNVVVYVEADSAEALEALRGIRAVYKSK